MSSNWPPPDHREEIAERIYWALSGNMLSNARTVKSLQVGADVYVDVIEEDWSTTSYRVLISKPLYTEADHDDVEEEVQP